MIFDEPVDVDTSSGCQPSETPQRLVSHHQRLAIRLLEADGAVPFFEALKEEFPNYQQKGVIPQSVAEMVKHFAECPAEIVQNLFYLVRRALYLLPSKEKDPDARKQAEEAAAGLYCLAACRLVDRAVRATGDYTFQVPSPERVICAIIATALFGGELRLLPAEQPGLPRPEFVFEIKVPASGDRIVESFERAIYVALFQNDRDAPQLGLDSESLNDDQKKRLAARLRTITMVRTASLALVVHGLVDRGAAQPFANKHLVPVMFPVNEATTALLGMDAGDLQAEIREFWKELEVLPDPAASSLPQLRLGASTMPKSDIHIQVTGGTSHFALATGDHSAAQTGAQSTANVGHREGTDLAALAPLLQELLTAIAELPSAKARQALTLHVEAAQGELAGKEQRDPGRIQRALDAIKHTAEALEGGEKILTLCNKAYQLLAPLLGLPTPPLP